jgi:ribosomal protein S18 acetylase RimI-like enzyme
MISIKKSYCLTDEHWKLLLLADPSENMIKEYIHMSSLYVAIEEDLLVGVIVLYEHSDKEIEIKNIAVKPSYQGKGIGRKLIHFGIKESRKLGYSIISICTGNSSTHQLALYQNCGFEIKTIFHDFFIKNYEEEIWENGIQCKDLIKLEQVISY